MTKLSEVKTGNVLYFPPGICTHTHGRREEYTDKNIGPIQTILQAREGGIHTTFLMPNTQPGLTNISNFTRHQGIVEEANLGRHYCYFWLRDDNLAAAELALANPRIKGLKVYPGVAATGTSVTTSFGKADEKAIIMDYSPDKNSTLDKAMNLVVKTDKAISFHSEDPALGHTPEAEISFVEHIIIPLAKRYPTAKIIVPHVSLRKTAEMIIETNRKYNTNIHMELTPHHLYFSEDDVQQGAEKDPKLKCFPPLRSKQDVEYLRSLLLLIGIDPAVKIMMGTDHAPHPTEKKDVGFEKAAGGISNIRDAMPVYLTIGDEIGMTEQQYIQFSSGTALQLFNLMGAQERVKFKKTEYVPSDDYYNGNVYNPFKGRSLKYEKV